MPKQDDKKQNDVKFVLTPETPSLFLSVEDKDNADKPFTYGIDAKAKTSTEMIPEGTIKKTSKDLEDRAGTSITLMVGDVSKEKEIKFSDDVVAGAKITKDEIMLKIGNAKISLKSDKIEISLDKVSFTLSADGLKLSGGKAINLDAETTKVKSKQVSIEGDKIEGKASEINWG